MTSERPLVPSDPRPSGPPSTSGPGFPSDPRPSAPRSASGPRPSELPSPSDGAITDLARLLAELTPQLSPTPVVHVVVEDLPDDVSPFATVREAEGLTLVLAQAEADRLGLAYDQVAAVVTLQVHSALEAVGLTAAVSTALARARMSCNVIAGAFHDHLLVPWERRTEAVAILEALARRSAGDRSEVPPTAGTPSDSTPSQVPPTAGTPSQVPLSDGSPSGGTPSQVPPVGPLVVAARPGLTRGGNGQRSRPGGRPGHSSICRLSAKWKDTMSNRSRR